MGLLIMSIYRAKKANNTKFLNKYSDNWLLSGLIASLLVSVHNRMIIMFLR